MNHKAFLQVLTFEAIWIALGWSCHLSSKVYLLLGVPLTIAFQLFVRRRPLWNLWVRDASTFRLNPLGIVAALAAMIIPVQGLIQAANQGELERAAYCLSACVGALGFGLTVQYLKRSASPQAVGNFALALMVGGTIIALGHAIHSHSRTPLLALAKLPFFLRRFAMYLSVCFALEEVVFRGLLDAHIWDGKGSATENYLSALYIGALWGLWHLPLVPHPNLALTLLVIPILVLSHVVNGLFLSLSWRASGTLLLPAICHALVDAFRDSLAN